MFIGVEVLVSVGIVLAMTLFILGACLKAQANESTEHFRAKKKAIRVADYLARRAGIRENYSDTNVYPDPREWTQWWEDLADDLDVIQADTEQVARLGEATKRLKEEEK